MRGRALKAAATLAGAPLSMVAAAAGINPGDLSRLLNERRPLTAAQAERIAAAIARLAQPDSE